MAALGLVAALLLAACSSEPDVEPIEPADTAADAGSDDELDDEAEEDEAVPEIFQGQLYPPLPDLEPDPNAGDTEVQEEVLPIFAEYYEFLETAFATNSLDESRLAELADDEYAQSVLAELEGQQAEGTVAISPDSTVGWVQPIEATDDSVTIGMCTDYGPESGVYDEESGELLRDVEGLTFIRVFTLSDVADADQRWRVTTLNSQEGEGDCDALRS